MIFIGFFNVVLSYLTVNCYRLIDFNFKSFLIIPLYTIFFRQSIANKEYDNTVNGKKKRIGIECN